MKNNQYLEHKIKEIVSKVQPSASIHGDFNTYIALYELASIPEWRKTEFERIEFISKRLDISKKLFTAYLSNGRKAVDTEITDDLYLELLVAILLKFATISQDNVTTEIQLKRFNTLFKALDLVQPEWLLPETELGVKIESAWQSILQDLSSASSVLKITSPPNLTTNNNDCKIIPLTVLFYEGPIARAYLATLKSLGFRPKKIIELVAAKDVVTKKFVGKWLPRGLRLSYAASIQQNKIHYWPKRLIKDNSDFVDNILNEVEKEFGFESAVIRDANTLSPLSAYSDCVESILIEGLTDNELYQYLLKEPVGAILFTGGGIEPATLLALKHLKFLHVHPGFLPDIRGADCALWSSLITGHTSATCFYMSPGIDTGDIINPYWLPSLSFNTNIKNIDRQSIYRAVYGFLDPWVRAFVLRDIIFSNNNYEALASIPQSEEDGATFHFMHQRLRNASFEILFK